MVEGTEIYPSIGKNVEENHLPTVLESLCMNCRKNGETRLLFTSIPFFRDVILASFYCSHCYYKTVDIQPGSVAQPKGCTYTLNILEVNDLQRQLVKSEHATVRFLEIDFEVPAKIGKLTTIEGIIKTAIEDLTELLKMTAGSSDPMREKLQQYLPKLTLASIGQVLPLTMCVYDPSGNSFVQNFMAPKIDPNLKVDYYYRSEEQNKKLGIEDEEKVDVKKGSNIEEVTVRDKRVTTDKLEQEHLKLPSNCPNCNHAGFLEMCVTDVPFFKEIIIFAFNCQQCGVRNNEIKVGGAIPPKGKRIVLDISTDAAAFQEDMRRDVVKSTSAGVHIPEIELEVVAGSLGGLYTTVEGLLDLIYDKLFDSSLGLDHSGGLQDTFAFSKGDSANPEQRSKLDVFKERFDCLREGKESFTLIIDDPLDNSFIYSPTAPEPEERLRFEYYERTTEQDDDLGINDMNTESYLAEQAHSTPILGKMKKLQARGSAAHPDEELVAMPAEYEHETVS